MVTTTAPPRARQRVEHAGSERLALARIGAAGELVEEHQRAGLRVAEDAHEVADVRAEGRQVLREVLVVADVGEDDLEDADGALGRARARGGPRAP